MDIKSVDEKNLIMYKRIRKQKKMWTWIDKKGEKTLKTRT